MYIFLFGSFIAILIIIVYYYYSKNSTTQKKIKIVAATKTGNVRRSKPIRKNVCKELTELEADSTIEFDSSDEQENDETINKPVKIGAKKAAKIAEKARKKEEREIEERYRAEQQKKEDEAFTKRKLEELKQEQKEKEEAEKEEKRIEEIKAKQQAEFEKWQSMMNVDAEYEESSHKNKNDDQIFRKKFIEYIKEHKCVKLDHLCLEFNIKTAACVELLENLIAQEELTGVLDDRGVFIYISLLEHQKIAKFINQRGRVRISELTQNISRLIDLAER